jgi:hypothetical protein
MTSPYAATQLGVDVAVDFGPPAPDPAAWVELYRAFVVQPYLVVQGVPYDSLSVMGGSVTTTGGVASPINAPGRLTPAQSDPGSDVRFLASEATAIATTNGWPSGGGDFDLAVRSVSGPPGTTTTTYDGTYQLLLDGILSSFPVVTVTDAQEGIHLSPTQIQPPEGMTWLMALVPHVSQGGAVYPILTLPGGAVSWRLGSLQVTVGSQVRGQSSQVALGGPILIGVSVDPVANYGILVAAGIDQVTTVNFDATGMLESYTTLDGIALGGEGPIDWLEIDYWHRALDVGTLDAAMACLEAAYGVTA